MNDMNAPPAWSAPEHYDPMGTSATHDFDLLDFENIDLDFDFGQPEQNDSNRQLGQLAEELNVQHLHNSFNATPVLPTDQNAAAGGAQQQHQQPPQQHHQQHAVSQPGPNYFEFSMPAYAQNIPAQQDQIFRHHAAVPPTPSSVEMHPDQARYMQQMEAQHAMFEQRYQMRKDDMTFTPLVSPAVTPHEARFRSQDMTTVPGAYFSPLTSPALAAQGHSQPHSQYPTTSGSSTGASPVNMDMDILGEPAMVPEEQQGRKLRSNKRGAPRSAAPVRIRQSPIVKAGKRKATASSLIPPKEVSDLLEEARGSRSHAHGNDTRRSRDSSETDSISPEPLSEMGPPPKPSSVTPSPAMLAQNHHASGQGVAPATPASLMRIHPSPTFGTSEISPPLDDLTLPEASLASRPSLARLDTAIQDGGDMDTPRLSARKTPKLSAQGTPGSAGISGRPSPMLNGMSTPTSPAFAMGTKKGDSKSSRLPKKRNSISSTLVSPALRPKISPSIKPLLPEAGVTDDTHALLLASKSNYQNILDGTTVPGVVYPTSLSTNLTSKRTSHKIAEQGRRNRINTALQEMQALLPSPQIDGKEAKSPEPGGPQSNNSKAAKVESAIEYIKQLQQQCRDKDKLIDQKNQEMEALRKELDALKTNSPADAAAPRSEATSPAEGSTT
ncbi:hypothetical protein DM02DRAFT_386096 [Periconia macrospinosa]|uniref:BHLH domain-containing protein n=1 Tax=Periconia macrospinosa TaxID=97972 RepID=A0A2V1DRL6_9PLEO|nr:hypothetical protein DM02DRAFT_386096 [Periconia macrospinosa]